VFRYHEHLKTGKWFDDPKEFTALLGDKGARDLEVEVGDALRLSTTIDIKDENGKVRHVHQLIDLKVGGTIYSPNPKTNTYVAYLPLDVLQDERGILLEGKITQINIRRKNANDQTLPTEMERPETVSSKIGDALRDDLVLVSWKEDAKDFLAITATKQIGNKIIISILLLLSLIGIANTMLMAVLERTKEMGMLRALGMTDGQIFWMITSEAFVLGLIGTVIGVIIGFAGTAYMVNVGLDYTSVMESMDMDDMGYRLATAVFKGGWNFHTMIGCLMIGPIVCALVAMGSAVKATKLKIVECLRFE
jgi:putative ABC transport system permease protein